MTKASDDVLAERERQKTVKWWTPEHDDVHRTGQMAGAAACYIMNNLKIGDESLALRVKAMVSDLWPWADRWWKPKDRRCDLVRAGALILAEIERLDRAAAREEG